jgi:hypothetical protein
MNKSISFIILLVFTFVGIGCKTTKPTKGDASTKANPVKLTLPLIQSVDPSSIGNIRFHFEKELVLTLVEEPGNGIYKVNEDGNLINLNEKTVRFPVSKLGKFVDTGKVTRKDSSFEITWEEESSDPELGLSTLRATYDDSLRVVITPDDLQKGKPIVIYQKAKYHLPQNYKEYFLVVGEIRTGQSKTVTGVKTPKENSSE